MTFFRLHDLAKTRPLVGRRSYLDRFAWRLEQRDPETRGEEHLAESGGRRVGSPLPADRGGAELEEVPL
jgi:hypothetical protein